MASTSDDKRDKRAAALRDNLQRRKAKIKTEKEQAKTDSKDKKEI